MQIMKYVDSNIGHKTENTENVEDAWRAIIYNENIPKN